MLTAKTSQEELDAWIMEMVIAPLLTASRASASLGDHECDVHDPVHRAINDVKKVVKHKVLSGFYQQLSLVDQLQERNAGDGWVR